MMFFNFKAKVPVFIMFCSIKGKAMTKLVDAIISGDLLTITSLVNSTNINQVKQYHPEETPLLCAIENNQLEAAKLLIELGADPNLKNYSIYTTPLEYACKHNNIEMVTLLLEHGASTSLTQHDLNPASYAVTNNNYPMIDLLLSHGLDLNAGFHLPLVVAAEDNNLTAAKYLLEHGANINADFVNNSLTSSAIVEAAVNGHQEMIIFLLENGANADTYTHCQSTYCSALSSAYNTSALYNALDFGYIEIAQILVNQGAGIQEGISPLHVAVLNGDIHEIESLLASGIDVDTLNVIGQSPFHFALYTNNIEALELLKQNDANITLELESNYSNLSPMEMAIYANAKDACIWLVNNGIDINKTYDYGDTALHMAASNGQIDIVSSLLELGANIHANGFDGNSVLSSGVYSDDPEMIAFLIENGAQLNVQNNMGQTELFVAANSLRHNENDNAVLKYLLDHGSDPTIKDINGNTALEYFKYINRNTGHLVSNYDDICEILGKYENPNDDKEVLQTNDLIDYNVDNIGEQLPDITQPQSQANVPPHDQVGLFAQVYNWMFSEQHIMPSVLEQ